MPAAPDSASQVNVSRTSRAPARALSASTSTCADAGEPTNSAAVTSPTAIAAATAAARILRTIDLRFAVSPP